MTAEQDDWIDIIRREAAIVVAQMQFKGVLIATSYDPANHTVKGILVPHGVETGDIPIGGGAIGNGFGDVWGPKVGTAEDLTGDQFSVHFVTGDPNNGFAAHRIFSTPDSPPVVQSGEMMRRHQLGQQLFFNAAGDAILSRDDGSMLKLKANGDVVAMPKTSGGTLYHGGDPDDGGTFDYVKSVSGVATNVKVRIG